MLTLADCSSTHVAWWDDRGRCQVIASLFRHIDSLTGRTSNRPESEGSSLWIEDFDMTIQIGVIRYIVISFRR